MKRAQYNEIKKQQSADELIDELYERLTEVEW